VLRYVVRAEDIKVYELYIQRVVKEGDLVWSRFKIYLGFNSGALVAVGVLLRDVFKGGASFDVGLHTGLAVIVLCIAGVVLSVAWVMVNRDGRWWQSVMNEEVRKVEASIYQDQNRGLYTAIIEGGSGRWQDVVSVNVYTAWFFVFAWLAGAVAMGLYCSGGCNLSQPAP